MAIEVISHDSDEEVSPTKDAMVAVATVTLLIEIPKEVSENLRDPYASDAISEMLRYGTVDWRYESGPEFDAIESVYREGDYFNERDGV